jgi:hypothetical protein
MDGLIAVFNDGVEAPGCRAVHGQCAGVKREKNRESKGEFDKDASVFIAYKFRQNSAPSIADLREEKLR